MTESKGAVLAYPRLCIAYFCQFAIWGSWAGALGGYVLSELKFSGVESGSLYNAIPFGAIIAPLFIGPIADRYFSAQKVISLLHFIGGLALLTCGGLCLAGLATFPILMGLMLVSGICFMPTMGLLNSVVFKHLPDSSKAPYVFVFGTFGWIAVNLFIAAFCGGASTPGFFFVSGGMGVFLALYALTLPDTPPKGAPTPGTQASGPGVLSLFKSFPFLIFVVCAFLASIPACNYFFPAQVPFLSERGYPSPVALTTINQFSEIFLMLALPFCIPRFGLKNVLLIGMAAWSIRYFLFSTPYFEAALAGLLLHGFCYSFLYVAAYMYAEKVAPAHLKASAQSMMVFLLLGVGQVLGGYGFGYMLTTNVPKHATMVVKVDKNWDAMSNGFKFSEFPFEAHVPLPLWSANEDSIYKYLDLTAQVNKWEFAKQVKKRLGVKEKESTGETVDLGKLLEGNPLTPQAIDAMVPGNLVRDGVAISRMVTCCGEGFTLDNAVSVGVAYKKDDLKDLGKAMAGGESDDFSLTRDQWLAAQAHNWAKIWRLPAILIAGCFVVFLLLGRNPKE